MSWGLIKNSFGYFTISSYTEIFNITNFEFEPREHVAIDVYGGSITLVGQAYDGADGINNRKLLSMKCPFHNAEQK